MNFDQISISDSLAGIAIFISLATFVWGFKKSKKLIAETEWHRALASEFISESNNFCSLSIKIVIAFWVYKEAADGGNQAKAQEKIEEIVGLIDEIRLSQWELQRYNSFAKKTADDFSSRAQALFSLIESLVSYARKPETAGAFNLEEIRTSQFAFINSSRSVHKELLGM